MKFWKRLKQLIDETLPEMRDKFLAYKDLKKLVRLISSSREASDSTNAGVVSSESGRNSSGLTNGNRVSAEEADFICLLNSEIDKINAFFVEQEEDFVIREKELQERIRSVISTLGPTGSRPYEAEYKDEMGKIRKEIVNFHGEMVLLENYSNLNYTGLAKILKKYDKRTGRLLRLPFIEKVLQQPFFTTDLLSKLVKQCEITMEMVFQMDEEFGERGERGEREAATSAAEESIFRNTVAALATMRELRKGSSTYSHFSLPPLNLPDPTLIQAFQLNSPIPIL